MSENWILVNQSNHIKTISLNNPTRKNALNKAMLVELYEALKASETDGTRVIVLTGTGKDFCSGADLVAGGQEMMTDVASYLKAYVNPLILQIHKSNIPVIAKIRGVCVGLGFNLALACDMLFASEDARFSQIFTNVALSSDGGGSFFLSRRIGYYKAFELMTLASIFTADEAYHLRLVNRICTDEVLDKVVDEIASRLASGPWVAIKHTKANLREGFEGSLENTLALEADNQGLNFKTNDFSEGVQAFLQKRKANFSGN
ncbi:MAG: enoyl-CoA hydratase-related protein [Thermonemataceae bacterium]|nr:enoyl-CoA hydratase-related protein [Thermonemataceae bacterium]